MHSKQPYHNLMSGAPSNEIKDELRKQRRMRSRRFYECRGAELFHCLDCYKLPRLHCNMEINFQIPVDVC